MAKRHWPPNPYDYSSPAGEELFAGRSGELKALDSFAESMAQGRTGHLLIHGPRAIGKTTLLRRLDERLAKKSVARASVTLDDGSATANGFLLEAISSLTEAVVSAGGLGGPSGPFYESLQGALMGDIGRAADGPMRVVRHAAASPDGRIPDLLVQKDLEELVDAATDIDSPGLVLIVDEADLLQHSPVTVQRIRNLIVMPGLVSLVLSGSDGLVGALDAAMAPMSRHFKRMGLLPLQDERETRDAMVFPLRSVGLPEHGLVPPDLVREVHALTGGRPFEIALLCNVMYERLARSADESLALDDEVLEEVAAQLRPSQEDQAALSVLRTLDPERLRLAAAYCVDPQLTAHEHSLLRTALENPTPQALETARAGVLQDWADLTSLGLGHQDGEYLRPAFGELGRLYLKYRARVVGQMDPNYEGRYSQRLASKIQFELSKVLEKAHLYAMFNRRMALVDGTDPDMSARVDALRERDFDRATFEPLGLPLPDEAQPDIERFLFILVPFEVGEDGFVTVLMVGLGPGAASSAVEVEARLRAAVQSAAQYQVRAGRLDVIELASDELSTWRRYDFYRLAEVTIHALWRMGKRDVALAIGNRFYDQVKEELDREEWLPDAGRLFLNNLGFVRLAFGHIVDALTLFERVATRGGLSDKVSLSQRQVLHCNLAAALAGLGRYTEAIEWCRQAIVVGPQEEAAVLAVFTPDPDWPKQPQLVKSPVARDIALGSMAAAQACMNDANALETARELVDGTSSRWARSLHTAIALRFGAIGEVEPISETDTPEEDEFGEAI